MIQAYPLGLFVAFASTGIAFFALTRETDGLHRLLLTDLVEVVTLAFIALVGTDLAEALILPGLVVGASELIALSEIFRIKEGYTRPPTETLQIEVMKTAPPILAALLVCYGIVLSGFSGGAVAGLGMIFYFLSRSPGERFEVIETASGYSWVLWIIAFFIFMILPQYWFFAVMLAGSAILLKVTAKMSLIGTMRVVRMPDIGGADLFVLEFGDILHYFTPYTATLFIFALLFTGLAIASRPERQLDIVFGGDAYYAKQTTLPEMRFRRFMAIACGLASMGAMVSGDLFNFTLFVSLVGITNIGIVAAVKSRHVLNAAYEYGIVAMVATLPLFGGAALVLATTGTLSIPALAAGGYTVPLVAKILLALGVIGEGMAPFYAAKAEMFRAPGAPYVIMCSLSSLLIFLRVVEIVITI